MRLLRSVFAVAATMLLGSAIAAPERAQAQSAGSYPDRPIRLIVPWGPGGNTDFLARLIQNKMQEALGQPLVIENRPGAGGNIGMEFVARATPDGYTVLMGEVGTIAINEAIYKDQRVKPITDLAAVSMIAITPSVFVGAPNFAPNSLKELVEYVKQRPGKVSFASQGAGSLNRLAMEIFAEKAGLQMIHVPYQGSGPAAKDILGGHVPMMFATAPSVLPHVQAGRMKAYGVTTTGRFAPTGDLPTMVEAGFPDLVLSSWAGLYVPARTPAPIVKRLHEVVVETMKDPAIKARIAEAGSIAQSSASPEEFAKFSSDEAARWSGVVKSANIAAQ